MLADAQFQYNQVGEAIISARQAHELHPYDTRAIAVLAEAQIAMGDRQAAITTLTKLVALQPDVVSGYLRLAAAQLGAGDTKAAAATVLSALEKSPRDQGARALLADIYFAAGELDRAQALGREIQEEDPKGALGFRIEGDVLLARRNFAGALDAYKKAAAAQVTGALLVRMHRAQSEGSGRIAGDSQLRAWIEKNPDDTETRFYLAGILSRSSRYREAADQYHEILRRLPNSPRALNDLAWTLHLAGDKRALDYARQAVNLAPTSAAAVDTLGWIMIEQGNLAEGVPALLKAVELDGSVPEIRYHLVQGLLKIGDSRRAKVELDTLLQSNKPFPQLAEARTLASQLGP
jgi:putative PEP-CTERM system TPR-repeat lipoprotein